MKICILDTETNGLIPKNSLLNLINLPHIVQIAWIIYDTITKTIEENDYILRCPVKISDESVKIHGITNEISHNGYMFSDVVDLLLEDVLVCDLIVGHNLNFDLNMLEIELTRLDRVDDIDILFNTKHYDTMKSSVNICKLTGKFGYKFPRLSEIYTHFFKKDFDNQHNALGDVRATLDVYRKLVYF